MHVAARARLVLARRPWLYWGAVAVVAALVALATHHRLAAIDAARAEWGTTRTVLVADGRLEPGDRIAGRLVELPEAAVPPQALADLPDPPARMVQHAGDGEVLTDLDITTRSGPAGAAPSGSVVVGLTDPLARRVSIGLPVQVAADGVVLAHRATVVDLVDDVVFVSVDEQDAPAVAVAAQQGTASMLFLP